MLHNALPSVKLDGEKSPHEALFKTLPDVSKFRVFGCLTWYYLPPHDRTSKLSPRSVPAVNLGCDPQRKGYIVYVPSLNRITTAYHLSFQETRFATFDDTGVAMPHAPTPLGGTVPLYNERRDVRRRPADKDDNSSDDDYEYEDEDPGDLGPDVDVSDPRPVGQRMPQRSNRTPTFEDPYQRLDSYLDQAIRRINIIYDDVNGQLMSATVDVDHVVHRKVLLDGGRVRRGDRGRGAVVEQAAQQVRRQVDWRERLERAARGTARRLVDAARGGGDGNARGHDAERDVVGPEAVAKQRGEARAVPLAHRFGEVAHASIEEHRQTNRPRVRLAGRRRRGHREHRNGRGR